MSVSIHKRNVRDALEPRREPYWAAPLAPGRFIGFRAITAKAGAWIARARDPDTGKQQYNALGEFTPTFDYDAACKAAHEWFASLDAGVKTKERSTVEDACRAYAEDRERAKGPRTAADAKWRFTKYVYGTPFGRTELSKLHTPAIKRWREGLGMTKAGQNRMMTALRAALNLAVENRQVAATAIQEWKAVKQHRKADGRREVFLDIAQRRALLDAATGGVRDLIEAAMLTGARPGELAGAPRSAWDSRLKTLKLVGKTGARTISLASSSAAVTLFDRVSQSKLPAAPLLARDDGKPWTRAEWTQLVREAAEQAVVKDVPAAKAKLPAGVVLYTLRHSFITEAITGGKSLSAVAHFTGTSLVMIQAHYGQLEQNAAVAQVAGVRML